MDNTQPQTPSPAVRVIRAKVIGTASAMCPDCGHRALVRGRYDDAEGDSRAWAYCNRCPYNYDD